VDGLIATPGSPGFFSPPPLMNMGASMQPPMMPTATTQPSVAPIPQENDVFLKEQYAVRWGPFVRSVQDRRRPIEGRWLKYRACWNAVHQDQFFKGEWFNHYIPAARRAEERFAVRCKQLLFPSPDHFEVYPMDDRRADLGQEAEAWKNYLLWRMQRIGVREQVMQLLRTYNIYGRAIAKSYLDFDDIPGEVWPSSRVVDPFMFYIWPETATTRADAQVCFENTMIPWERYRELSEAGVCDPIDGNRLSKPDWPYHYADRLGQAGLTSPTDVNSGGSGNLLAGPEKMVFLTEIFVKKGPTCEQIWIVWNVSGAPKCVRIEPNYGPLPYRFAMARLLPGEQYTNSMFSDLANLNQMLNDQVNMTLEGQAMFMFPIAAVNPDLVARSESLIVKPRAKWMLDPAGLEFKTTPNVSQAGFQGIQMGMAWLDSFSGSNPLAEGTPTRGMPRAGFAVSSLIGLSMSDIRDVAEKIEDEILTPMLQDFYRLTKESIPAEQVARIPGSEMLRIGKRVSVSELRGAYNFRWVGTLQAQDQQVRAQRLLTLLNTIGKIYPQMVTDGWKVDFGTLGKRIWRDGMGERGADTIFYRDPVWEQIQQMAEAQGLVLNPDQLRQMMMMVMQQQQAQAGQPGQAQGATASRPSGPGASAPATAEQSERQMSRGMTEAGVGPTLSGLGVG
jgi:hypothetical protein